MLVFFFFLVWYLSTVPICDSDSFKGVKGYQCDFLLQRMAAESVSFFFFELNILDLVKTSVVLQYVIIIHALWFNCMSE